MKNLLKSTTSLGLSLALAFPQGAFAQQQDVPACGPVGEASEFPCAFEDQTVETAEELRIAADLSANVEADAEAEGADVETADAEADEVIDDAADAADDATDAVEDMADEAAEEAAEAGSDAADAADDVADETAQVVEEATEAEADVNATVSTDGAEAEAETNADAPVETVEEVAPADGAEGDSDTADAPVMTDAPEGDAVAADTATADDETMNEAADSDAQEISEDEAATPLNETGTETEAEASAEADTAVDADTAIEADTAAEANTAVETDTASEANTVSEAETAGEGDTAAEAETATESEAPVENTATVADGEADAEAEAALTDEQLQAREERREQRREERRAQRRAEREAAAAAAAAAAEETGAEAEVVTEKVTEEDVRSSDEDFDTKVTAAGEAAPQANDSDSGMSDFEKALLLGLGAVAVGSVLNNGEKIVSRTGDRVVVQDPDGELRVLKDDNALIRRPGDQVQTQTFDDGSTRTIVTKADGSRIETIRARDGSVLRRTNFDAQGREYVLVDDLVDEQEVIVSELPKVQETQRTVVASQQDEEALRRALQAQQRSDQGRTFSLRQVREIQEVRSLAPQLELDAVRFPTGSAAIQPEQAKALANIGATLRDMIQKDPRTVILVEGHTDAVGDASYNLALSDRRAETVALALTEYFDVPPANLVTQGYGESQLRVPTNGPEPANRRAVVRNITGLLR
ncbi:OmpA family protein [Sulfitobacter sp. S0837]|uniref:OmpA family protein n=1 Tax=Sulfitobacter maritimus TaxID=2741719 RepID=UPI0015833FA6|nr:OmpA family protein [Sulfitobacter maritimus]NUH64525.1 OmpA family protein [Sulfitobacter maritimus]